MCCVYQGSSENWMVKIWFWPPHSSCIAKMNSTEEEMNHGIKNLKNPWNGNVLL